MGTLPYAGRVARAMSGAAAAGCQKQNRQNQQKLVTAVTGDGGEAPLPTCERVRATSHPRADRGGHFRERPPFPVVTSTKLSPIFQWFRREFYVGKGPSALERLQALSCAVHPPLQCAENKW
jgi:hypothetical protein